MGEMGEDKEKRSSNLARPLGISTMHRRPFSKRP